LFDVIAKAPASSPLILVPVIVAEPLPTIATVTNCCALTSTCGVENGTPKDKSPGDTDVDACALAVTAPTPARQQTAATTVIERTTTFHAIMFFLLEHTRIRDNFQNFCPARPSAYLQGF